MAKFNFDRFYGIEISDFPARIAEVAMWMMDHHIMNARLSAAFGESFVRIPLKTSPNIVNADALETDWANVLAPEKCFYIFGNPPFGGFVQRDEARQDQMAEIAKLGLSGNRLDYVCAWFIKVGEYVRGGEGRWKPPRIGFVATNSITQGEQVAQLWPLLFERYGLEIAFAHRTFAWMSDARGKAHVHCVIIGLTRRDDEPKEKRLFSYDNIKADPHESRHAALTPYLFDASALADRHLVVEREASSICAYPEICVGTKPVDGGHYIFNESDRARFLQQEPSASRIMRPFVGGYEYINGVARWILVPESIAAQELRQMPHVIERISKVRHYRGWEGGKLAKSLASTPTAFHVTVLPNGPFLAIPEVSSERREYVPIGYLEPPIVPSNQILVIRKLLCLCSE